MRAPGSGTLAAALVAAALFLSSGAFLVAADMDLTLLPVPLTNAGSIAAIQLFERDGAQLLAFSGGQLSLVTGAPGPARLVEAMPLDTGSTWEARQFGDELTVLYTEAGSAVSWVMSKSTRFPRGARINEETFGVYLQPHFVREPESRSGLTAIRHRGATAQVVLFSHDAATQTDTVREIGRPATAILDARLVRDPNGYLLFTLAQAAAEAPAPVRRGHMPAVLTAERLDEGLNARGEPIPVFGRRPVYEFDVDRTSNGDVAVVATTPAGAILGRGVLADAPLAGDQWKETAFPQELASPSLIVSQGVTYVAAMERVGRPEARVLRGRVD